MKTDHYKSHLVLDEISLKLSQDSRVVDHNLYSATIAGLPHSTKMKLNAISQTSQGVYTLKIYLTLTP